MHFGCNADKNNESGKRKKIERNKTCTAASVVKVRAAELL